MNEALISVIHYDEPFLIADFLTILHIKYMVFCDQLEQFGAKGKTMNALPPLFTLINFQVG